MFYMSLLFFLTLRNHTLGFESRKRSKFVLDVPFKSTFDHRTLVEQKADACHRYKKIIMKVIFLSLSFSALAF